MEFICNKKYIIIPASHEAQKKRLLFYVQDKLVFDLVTAVDYDNPDYYFPVDMERFMGEKIRVQCDKDIELSFEQTDSPVLDYSGKYRPLAHFTTKRGWINDPNGLAYVDGKYLMYYQHNPAATTWENMHWGSAVSQDLMHWEEKGDVLFPDENGTIFSGSAIVDKHNATGLRQGEEDVVCFFYTCAGDTSEASRGKLFTQNLAYSTDGGKTLIRYEKPVVEHIVGENRDPKVIYYQPDNSYIMALYLEGHEFALLKSKNLIDWKEIQRLSLPDDAECPDFYPLPVDGDQGHIKWVLSAASDRYYIGSFDGNKYTPQSEQLRLNYGNSSYAAQSWSDIPEGRRIRTAFAKVVIPTMPFGCCMNIPQEMSLKTINGNIRLCAEPVKEIETLYRNTEQFDKVHVTEESQFKAQIGSKACDITLNITCENDFKLSLFGLDIEYDNGSKVLKCGDMEVPATSDNGRLTLRVIYDTIYAEIFAESGSVFMGMTYIQDSSLNRLTVSSHKATIERIVISEMESFY